MRRLPLVAMAAFLSSCQWHGVLKYPVPEGVQPEKRGEPGYKIRLEEGIELSGFAPWHTNKSDDRPNVCQWWIRVSNRTRDRLGLAAIKFVAGGWEEQPASRASDGKAGAATNIEPGHSRTFYFPSSRNERGKSIPRAGSRGKLFIAYQLGDAAPRTREIDCVFVEVDTYLYLMFNAHGWPGEVKE